MFQSERKRLMVYQFGVGLIVEWGIAYIIARVIGAEHESVAMNTLLVWGAMLAASLLLWLRSAIAAWAAFYLFGRKFAAKAYETDLRTAGFPAPENYERSPEDYFDRIAADDGMPIQIRIKAAVNAGYLRYPASTSRILESIRVSMPMEDALNAMR